MSLFLTALSLGVTAGWIRGGRLRNLVRLPLFGWPLVLVWLAFGIQLWLLLLNDSFVVPMLVGSYALVAVAIGVVLVRVVLAGEDSRAVLSLATIGLGWLLNVVVIAANGGMPYSPDALAAAGMSPEPADHGVLIPKRVAATEETHLAVLGDMIPLPLFGTFVSLGDLVLAAGLSMLVFVGMTHRSPVPAIARY